MPLALRRTTGIGFGTRDVSVEPNRIRLRRRGCYTGMVRIPMLARMLKLDFAMYKELLSAVVGSRAGSAKAVVLGAALVCLAACGVAVVDPAADGSGSQETAGADRSESCTNGGRVLNVGFYAFFAPVSYSADADPAADGFSAHRGYEADLLSALETMEDAGLTFSRRSIAVWDGIWLLSDGPEYDLIGGGITILESRTRDAAGNQVVVFTDGHITFRQSLLVRAADAERLASHASLTGDVRVGAWAGTTGEFRLLELTGLVDANGVLVAGVRVETPQGTVVADGSADYAITAAGATKNLVGREHIHPPDETMPQVIYLGDELGEGELIAALRAGAIDALARGEVGNRDAAHTAEGGLVVTALDDAVELGGFTLAVEDAALAACINEKINLLTDNRRIGYAEWVENPLVFLERAEMWYDGAR